MGFTSRADGESSRLFLQLLFFRPLIDGGHELSLAYNHHRQ